LVVAASVATAQPQRAGPELAIDGASSIDSSRAAIASNANGRFVVSWGARAGNGLYNIRAQRFDHSGLALEPAFQVNPATVPATVAPDVAVASDGGFVVTWPGQGPGCDRECVFAQRYDSNGASAGGAFQVNSYTPFYQTNPVVAADSLGNFVVVWQSRDFEMAGQDGSTWGVFGQRYDATGLAQGTEFQVNAYTTGPQSQPSIAMDNSGNFVVAWQGYIASCANRCVFLRRFDATAAALGGEFVVNQSSTDARTDASVARNATGRFVVVWTSYGAADGDGSGVFARLFDTDGTALSDEFQINVWTTGDQDSARASIDSDGSFTVVWQSSGDHDGSGEGVFARRFSASAVAITGEIPVNTFRALDQRLPAVAAQGPGDFVVAWNGPGQDNQGVFVQRFCDQATTICDVCPGFDDTVDSDLDGIPDGCDPCTNIGDASSFTAKSKLSSKNKGCRDCPDHKLALKGSFTLPPTRPFASLDPSSDGASVVISAGSTYTMADVLLPAGAFAGSGSAGWRINGAGTAWSFRDKTATSKRGRFSLRLRDAGAKLPGLVRIVIKAKDSAFPVSPGESPMTAVVTLGGLNEAIDGACGEVVFSAERCRLDAAAKRLSCK